MGSVLVSFPIMVVLLILQTAIFSRIPLLQGTTDLVLLALVTWAIQKRVLSAWQWGIVGGMMVSAVSAIPFGMPLVGYLLAIGLTLILRRQVWQTPILAVFIAVLGATLISQSLDLIALKLVGNPLPIVAAFNQVILPSILLNLVFSIPAYAIFGDLARSLYPDELDV